MASNVPAPARGVNGLGLVSLILGVAGFAVALIPDMKLVSLPVSAIGILCGLVAMGIAVKGKQSSLVLPIAGLLISGVAFAVPFVWNRTSDTVVEGDKGLEKEDKEIRDGEAIKVSVADMVKEYRDEKRAADKKYKDHVVEVEGEVLDSQSNKITLKGEGEAGGTVECSFTDAHKDALARLKKGEKVTVRGKGNGDFLGTPRLRRCIVTR